MVLFGEGGEECFGLLSGFEDAEDCCMNSCKAEKRQSFRDCLEFNSVVSIFIGDFFYSDEFFFEAGFPVVGGEEGFDEMRFEEESSKFSCGWLDFDVVDLLGDFHF